MDEGPDDDGPTGGLVECDVLVERNEIVERSAAQNRNEVAANRQQDVDDIDMAKEGGCSGNSWLLCVVNTTGV